MTKPRRSGHRLVAFPVALALAAALAACGGRAEGASGQAVADTGSVDTIGGRQPSGARLVAVIGGLDTPESARYDPEQDVFFVSDMTGYGSDKDGNGLISRVSAADPSQVTAFARGGKNGVELDAPKGMAIHGDTLWVADIDKLRAFDRHSGLPLATIDLAPQHAVLLNDVAVAPDGTLRVTDSGIKMTDQGVLYVGGDKIFAIGPGQSVSIVTQGAQLRAPNGITWDATGKRWLVVNFDPFASQLRGFSPDFQTVRQLGVGKGKWDGVEVTEDGGIILSSWSDSSIHLIADEHDRQVVRNVPAPADIGYDTRRHRVWIPISNAGRIEVWEFAGRRGVASRRD
jgi:SMP-30/Gluconolactonase/LRE-like region